MYVYFLTTQRHPALRLHDAFLSIPGQPFNPAVLLCFKYLLENVCVTRLNTYIKKVAKLDIQLEKSNNFWVVWSYLLYFIYYKRSKCKYFNLYINLNLPMRKCVGYWTFLGIYELDRYINWTRELLSWSSP